MGAFNDLRADIWSRLTLRKRVEAKEGNIVNTGEKFSLLITIKNEGMSGVKNEHFRFYDLRLRLREDYWYARIEGADDGVRVFDVGALLGHEERTIEVPCIAGTAREEWLSEEFHDPWHQEEITRSANLYGSFDAPLALRRISENFGEFRHDIKPTPIT